MQFGIQLVLCVSWTMFTPGFYTTKISGMMPRKKKSSPYKSAPPLHVHFTELPSTALQSLLLAGSQRL